MDEKTLSCVIDLLEVLVKKSTFDSVVSGIVDASGKEVESVYSSVINGMASKRFLESSSSATLWTAMIQVLNTSAPILSDSQCNDLRSASEVRVRLNRTLLLATIAETS
jgi:hypothetical protein